MLIGIEASRANKTIKTGVEWYAWHVIQELKKLSKGDSNTWILYTNKILQSGLELLPENWYELRAKWPLPYGWTQLRMSWELIRKPVDVLYLPCTTMPRYVPKKTVVTVHDVGFHRLPMLYKKRQVHIHEIAMREAIKRAARIVTVSEFSRREISEAYQIDPARITVTLNGIDHDLYRPISDSAGIRERLSRYRISEPFFVAIGRLEAKKNILGLIKAFTNYKSQRGVGDPHRLVLIGVPGYGYEDIKHAIETSSARQSIVELGYVPELDLPWILNAATALIHPSWYEGFGIPPLLAMASGCPVISSSAASLPEVIGDGGLLFSPDQPAGLVAAMERLDNEDGLREKLRTAGALQAAKFTWENTARLTLPTLTNW